MTTLDGLVYEVEVHLVYRVVEIDRALIQIDDLVKGLREALVLSVQEVLRGIRREDLSGRRDLDGDLSSRIQDRCTPWGVSVIQASFGTITPSDRTLRVTQMRRLLRERQQIFDIYESRGLSRSTALALLGRTTFPFRRQLRAVRREESWRRERLLRRARDATRSASS